MSCAAARFVRKVVLSAGLGAWAASAHGAITVTRADTFTPGVFWSTMTYGWTITASPLKGPFDAYEVVDASGKWRPTLNTGTVTGPGDIAGAQPVGGIRVQTLLPGGFPRPFTGGITTSSNPTFLAGQLSFTIALAGVPVNQPTIASIPTFPGNSTTTAGSLLVVYPGGTFPPSVPIDLFQETTLASFDAQIGFATTDAFGGASIPLDRALLDPGASELLIGLGGQIAYSVPAPGAGALFALGLTLLVRRRRAR